MKKFALSLLCSLLSEACFSSSLVYPETVGNGSVIAPAPGELEPYGVNASEAASPGDFMTRHFKRGNSSGIGGSFLQTTSPTSESSPAVNYTPQAAVHLRRFSLPGPAAAGPQDINPALQSFTPALPARPRSSAQVNPALEPSRFEQNQSLESLPSFSQRPSFMQKMQFGGNSP